MVKANWRIITLQVFFQKSLKKTKIFRYYIAHNLHKCLIRVVIIKINGQMKRLRTLINSSY